MTLKRLSKKSCKALNPVSENSYSTMHKDRCDQLQSFEGNGPSCNIHYILLNPSKINQIN